MNIAIIGSGNVGGTLGTRWSKLGHRVAFSSRNPQSEEMRKLVEEAGPGASAASVAEAVRASDVVVVATPWPTTEQAVKSAGDLSGKVLIDATNPLLPDLSALSAGTSTSGAEMVASWAQGTAPGARVVKAFNTIGYNIMQDPKFAAGPALLFYCGDDAEAKRIVHQLATELGFDARDAGPLTQARALEPLALLWISLAYRQGYGRDFAFQLVRR